MKGPILIGEGTIIRSGSYLQGPLVIGEGCEIGPNAVIYPSSSIGKNVRVEPFTLIEHSVIMDDVGIGASSHISHSVLGYGVEVGSHFTANSEDCHILTDAGYHEVEDVGVLIGQDTKIGNGVTALSGSMIGANCRKGSGGKLRGTIPNSSIVV